MFKKDAPITGQYYHLYNRGVAKNDLFIHSSDYKHFLNTLRFYVENKPSTKLSLASRAKTFNKKLFQPTKNPMVEVIAYCLMPNHFHLLVKQLKDNGIADFMRRSLNSYSRYFNTKYNRVGALFQGVYQSVLVENEEQLLHLSRYIHLNPFVANLTKQPIQYRWSSLKDYLNNRKERLANPALILTMLGSADSYKNFIEDYKSYMQEFVLIQNLTIEKA